MYSQHDPNPRVSLLEMNSEIENAQLELLSAHCAAHQLRQHYSTDDLARFGRRDKQVSRGRQRPERVLLGH